MPGRKGERGGTGAMGEVGGPGLPGAQGPRGTMVRFNCFLLTTQFRCDSSNLFHMVLDLFVAFSIINSNLSVGFLFIMERAVFEIIFLYLTGTTRKFRIPWSSWKTRSHGNQRTRWSQRSRRKIGQTRVQRTRWKIRRAWSKWSTSKFLFD